MDKVKELVMVFYGSLEESNFRKWSWKTVYVGNKLCQFKIDYINIELYQAKNMLQC